MSDRTAALNKVKGNLDALLEVLGVERDTYNKDRSHVKSPVFPDGKLSISDSNGVWLYNDVKGGGKGGSIVDAVMVRDGISQGEAVARVLERFGDYKPQAVQRKAPAKTFPTIEAAVESLERQGHAVQPQYYADGFTVLRCEGSDGKTFRPLMPVEGGYAFGNPDPRPLYRRDEIGERPGEPVVVCEGEKAADCAARFGLLGITSSGGSSAPAKTDWSPVKGRDVVVCPDNDEPGSKYAVEVQRLALAAGARSVRIRKLPGLPDKGDVVEYVEAQRQEGKADAAITASLRHELGLNEPAPDMRTGPRTFGDWLNAPELRRPVDRLATQYSDLDKALDDGFVLGGLYVLAGKTGGGKTTFAGNIARRVALAGVRVLLLSLEDPPLAVVRKFLAASASLQGTSVSLRALERLEFTPLQGEAVRKAREVLRNIPLILDGDTTDLEAVELMIRAHVAQGVRLVIIDQMSWLGFKATTSYERACEISRRLKFLARELGVVLLLLVQVNRQGSQQEQGPGLHDLRDSGTIEQDADGVLIVKKCEKFQEEKGRPPKPAHLTLGLDKHRHGPDGPDVKVDLSWFQAEHRVESYNPFDVTGVHA